MVIRDVTPETGDGLSLFLSPPNVQQHQLVHNDNHFMEFKVLLACTTLIDGGYNFRE